MKVMQPEGGIEFKSLREYFQKKGIIQRTTCTYTSEQNRLVERKCAHIVESGLTLLAQASLPLKFWSDAFAIVVFLINRLPTKALQFKSPLEVLFNIRPDYQSLKVFGCLCFPCLGPYNTHKLNFRSSPYAFLGYATNQKGYKCLDNNGRIFISSHVVFNEEVYNPKLFILHQYLCILK